MPTIDDIQFISGAPAKAETMTAMLEYLKVCLQHTKTQHAPVNAQKNIQSDWNELNSKSDAYIHNKPIPGAGLEIDSYNHLQLVLSSTLKIENNAISLKIGSGIETSYDGVLQIRLSSNLEISDGGIALKRASGMIVDQDGALQVNIGSGLERTNGSVCVKCGTGLRFIGDYLALNYSTEHFVANDQKIELLPSAVQGDWNSTDTNSPSYIKNKPNIPTIPVSLTNHPSNSIIHITAYERSIWNSKQDPITFGSGIETVNGTTQIKLSSNLEFNQYDGSIALKRASDMEVDENGALQVSIGKGLERADGSIRVKAGTGLQFIGDDLALNYSTEHFIADGQMLKIFPYAVQGDWNSTDTNALSYIKNKPRIPVATSYATSEFLDCSNTGHAGSLISITIPQATLGFRLMNSVTLKIADSSDSSVDLSVDLYMLALSNGVVVACSNDSHNQTQNYGKFVTWHFDNVTLPAGDITFELNSNPITPGTTRSTTTRYAMRPHVIANSNVGIKVVPLKGSGTKNDWNPAIGVNMASQAKQDTIEDLSTIRSNASTGATHASTTAIHVTTSEKSTWNGKQDAISDLSTIRSNASTGATHASTTSIHVSSDDRLAWDGKQDAISDLSTIRSNASTGATHASTTAIHVTTSEKSTWNGKQDTISDLSTIRSNASTGATHASTTAIHVTTSEKSTWNGKQDPITFGSGIETVNGTTQIKLSSNLEFNQYDGSIALKRASDMEIDENGALRLNLGSGLQRAGNQVKLYLGTGFKYNTRGEAELNLGTGLSVSGGKICTDATITYSSSIPKLQVTIGSRVFYLNYSTSY